MSYFFFNVYFFFFKFLVLSSKKKKKKNHQLVDRLLLGLDHLLEKLDTSLYSSLNIDFITLSGILCAVSKTAKRNQSEKHWCIILYFTWERRVGKSGFFQSKLCYYA